MHPVAALFLVAVLQPSVGRAETPPAADDDGDDPSAEAEDDGDRERPRRRGRGRAKAGPSGGTRSERQAIIDRLRCENVDPRNCLVPDDPFGGEGDMTLTSADGEAAGAPLQVDEAAIDAMLQAVGASIAEREESFVGDAGEEMLAQRYAELQYFGVSDHFVDPPYDYYRDPIRSVERVPMLYLDQIDPADFDIPLVVNERVQDWMVYLLTRGRKHFVKWIGRKQRYEGFIHQELDARGMPRDLIYQAMIESGFSPYAYSWAKAAGIWQFIPGTGKRYGLAIDWWVDQRRDPYEATRAALDYMEYLYGMFGDWHVASAAYNAGEGKLSRAIKRYETRNYWEICAGDYLRPETKDYVPKMLAAAILSKYPERYGLLEDVPEWLDPWEFDIVTVPEATDVGIIAEITGTDEEVILEMNPSLRRWCTPPGVDAWDVRIPVGTAEGFHEKLAAIPEDERLTFKRYRVARGDTLGKIASRYGVSVSSISQMNSIRNPNSISVGQYLVIPVRASSGRARDVIHTVERGESLGMLASRYGVSVGEIKEWNKLHGDVIQIGQRLTMHLGGGAKNDDGKATGGQPAAVAAATPPSNDDDASADAATDKGARTRKGPGDREKAKGDEGDADASAAEDGSDTNDSDDEATGDDDDMAAAVAATAGDEPAPEGRARAASAGAQAAAPAASSKPTSESMVHVVSRGDSLSELAQHYDVSVKKLKRWNSLSRDTIYVGQQLTVYPGPRSETRKVIHTVASGDSLWKIAVAHGVSVGDLQGWNALGNRSTIRPGQRLVIFAGGGSTSSSSTRTVTHKVQRGDSLWSIAKRYGVSIQQIKQWNDLTRDTVKIGQRLTLTVR